MDSFSLVCYNDENNANLSPGIGHKCKHGTEEAGGVLVVVQHRTGRCQLQLRVKECQGLWVERSE